MTGAGRYMGRPLHFDPRRGGPVCPPAIINYDNPRNVFVWKLEFKNWDFIRN